jgi:hypothetical protein
VFVGADGSVECTASDAPFAVSEIATLLESLLPAGGTTSTGAIGVPGGLRYTIARARLEVDAPPFDSMADFSRALVRHERGDRVAAIQRVIARVNSQRPNGPLDRRRSDAAVAHLRRQLRDADARAYDQQRAIDTLSAMTTQPPSGSRRLALAAGVAIGLTFIGAGEAMRERPTPPPRATEAAQTVHDAGAATTPARQPAPETIVPKTSETPTTKRTVRSAVRPTRDRTPARPRRFQWLRTRFAFRSDPL